MTRRCTPGIQATAFGVFSYCVGFGSLLGIVGAAVAGITMSLGAIPSAIPFVLLFAIPLGATFGLLVGIVTGFVFAVLVVIGERRNAQARVADAMPWVAVLIANGATLFAFVSWAPFVLIAVTQMSALALACFGGTRIARAYLRAEEPRIRQLIH
jgi:hypothetical protein